MTRLTKALLLTTILTSTVAFGQSELLDTTAIDTIQKNSAYVIVGKIINISHRPDIIDLGTGYGITTFKVEKALYQSTNVNQASIFWMDTIDIIDVHECKESPTYYCSLEKFKKGDSCIVFIGRSDTNSNQYETYKVTSGSELLDDTPFLSYSSVLEKYISSHGWYVYKNFGICRRYTNRDWDKDRWNIIEGHYISSEVISPTGKLLERTIVSSGNKILVETTEEYDLDGNLQKRIVYRRKKVNPWLRRRKYPKYSDANYYRSVTKTYNGKGKRISKHRDFWLFSRPGSKF